MPLRVRSSQVTRFLFRKQHLTPRARCRDLLALVRDIGPVRATPTTSLHLALWARSSGLGPEAVERALYTERVLVRVPALQARLYAVPAHDMAAYYRIAQPMLRSGLADLDDILYTMGMRADRRAQREHTLSRRVAQRVLEIMSTRGPSTIEELADLLPELRERIPHDPEHPEVGHSLLGTRLIPAMCAEGMLVRAQTRGGWRSDQFSYVTLASWLPGMDLEAIDHQQALDIVLTAYVRAYGPVTIGDAQAWLGGLPRREVASAIMRLPGLLRLQIGETRGDYVLFEEQADDLLNTADEEPAAALLPPRDAVLTAYSDASRLIRLPLIEQGAERIYDRAGEALGTVWLDGLVIGTWWLQSRDERITVRLFEDEGPEAMALVGEEARRLIALYEFTAPELDIGTDA